MKLADTFAPWLQQSPSPAAPSIEVPQGEPEPDQVKHINLKPDPVPFHTDGRDLDLAGDGDAWLCSDCGRLVEINDVFLAPGEERVLTMWTCDLCEVRAITPDDVRQPPPNFTPTPYVAISVPDPPPPDPATQRRIEAVMWLEDNLTQPRRMGEVFAQWTGGTQRLQCDGALRWESGRDGADGHWLDDLEKAAKFLGVTVFNGPDDCFWWTVPETAAQAQERTKAA